MPEKEKRTPKRISRRQLFRRLRKPSEEEPKAKENVGQVEGTVKYPWGQVADATVTIGGKSIASDSNGKYVASDLAPGTYDLIVHAPFPGYVATSEKVEVVADQKKTVDIFLDFERAVVEGHVYGEDGKPIADATISGVLCGKDVDSKTTDEKGYFKFDAVTPGNRLMRVNAVGFMGAVHDFVAKQGEMATLEIRLTPAAYKLHGTVTDSDGRPLQADVVVSRSGVIVHKTSSDATTGHYEFPLVHGTYDLLATAQGLRSQGWRGEVSSDAEVNIKFDPPLSKGAEAQSKASPSRNPSGQMYPQW